ncbi:MAG: glycosyltransferase family 4 protein [Burkholderiales bacterium]|nr:glycosyltransferase family 4 protein [Burkholderiales bacterium]
MESRREPLSICQLAAVDFTVQHFLTALVEGMVSQGWRVTCVCSDGPYVPVLRANGKRVKIVPISRGLNPMRHLPSLFRLVRLFRRERFDVLHAHTPVAALLGRIAARIAGVPMVVYTAHGFYFHEHMSPMPRRLFIALEWLGGRLTDLLFTQSEEDARAAVELGLLESASVIAIGNGVDPARFRGVFPEQRASTRAKLGIPIEAVVVGIVGRMVDEKGYREYFSAACQLAERHPQAWFVAVGDRLSSDHADGVESELQHARSTLGPRLVLTGMRTDVPDLLGAMDIFTLPSYREGMPRTIIEAMMSGLPVVATDIRGSREEVVEGVTGHLVPARDANALSSALSRLIASPEQRALLGSAGRRRALELYDEHIVVARQISEIRSRLPAALKARA